MNTYVVWCVVNMVTPCSMHIDNTMLFSLCFFDYTNVQLTMPMPDNYTASALLCTIGHGSGSWHHARHKMGVPLAKRCCNILFSCAHIWASSQLLMLHPTLHYYCAPISPGASTLYPPVCLQPLSLWVSFATCLTIDCDQNKVSRIIGVNMG